MMLCGSDSRDPTKMLILQSYGSQIASFQVGSNKRYELRAQVKISLLYKKRTAVMSVGV